MAYWPRYPLLYEINTRVWLRRLSEEAGRQLTLAEVPDSALAPILEGGYHGVWLMGVWESGEAPANLAKTHKADYLQVLPDLQESTDIHGSPYAVSRYEVDRSLGGQSALVSLRKRLQDHGVRMILDFVSNHTATDHPFVRENPAVYVQGSREDLRQRKGDYFCPDPDRDLILAHGRDPYFPPWNDTVAINYYQPQGRSAMAAELLRIARQCDGVRCDMAMLILPAVAERLFGHRLGKNPLQGSPWRELIPACLAINPNFLFIAEAYWGTDGQLLGDGFDYVYDKTLYDRILDTHRGDREQQIRSWLSRGGSTLERAARFVENHDEPRALVHFGRERSQAAAVLSFFPPGLRLVHQGQELGHRFKLPVQLSRGPAETDDPQMRAFYDRLLALLPTDGKEGTFSVLSVHRAGPHDSTAEQMIALSYRKSREDEGLVAIVNLGESPAYARVPLRVSEWHDYLLLDLIAPGCPHYERQGRELASPGLFVALAGYQSHVFRVVRR